jgi:hypothetical protein
MQVTCSYGATLAGVLRRAASKRLDAIPGVGPALATALVACVADPRAFRSGRDFSAWIGLVPKQRSSGGKDKLGAISRNRSHQCERYVSIEPSKKPADHGIELPEPEPLFRYDAPHRAFLGHESAMEFTFFVTEDALKRVQPDMRHDRAGILNTFDNNRELICRTAAKVFARGRKASYDLHPDDF